MWVRYSLFLPFCVYDLWELRWGPRLATIFHRSTAQHWWGTNIPSPWVSAHTSPHIVRGSTIRISEFRLTDVLYGRGTMMILISNHRSQVLYRFEIWIQALTIPWSVVCAVFMTSGYWVTARVCSRTDSCSSCVQLTPSPGWGTHQLFAYQA